MRYAPISNHMFRTNRKRVMDCLKPGSVSLISSNYQMPRNGDQYFMYRQNSDLFYLSGIEQEKTLLLLIPDASSDQKEILFILNASSETETWEGQKLTPEKASEISGIKTVLYLDEFDKTFHSLAMASNIIYLNLPEYSKFQPEVVSRDFYYANQFHEKYPAHIFDRLAPIMHKLRLKKSPEEIDLIQKSIRITQNAFLRVLEEIRPGMLEYEIEALITYEFLRQGTNGHAYAPIIASGQHACVLHYIKNDGECRNGDLLLMDFGAEYAYYAADLSRTIPVNRRFTQRQKEVYDAVLEIFKYARNLIKPGITINDFHQQVCEFSEEVHIKLGLYSMQEAKNYKGDNPLWYQYYMHGTSHFLGLDVHDAGTRETVIEPNMILTCEPGIYIPSENIGVRIENNLLITEKGNIDLMEDIPAEADEIESLMHHG